MLIVLFCGCSLPFTFDKQIEEPRCKYFTEVKTVAMEQDVEKLEFAYKTFSGMHQFLETEDSEDLNTMNCLEIMEIVQSEYGLEKTDSSLSDLFDETLTNNGFEDDIIQVTNINKDVTYEGETFTPRNRLVEIFECFADGCKAAAIEKE